MVGPKKPIGAQIVDAMREVVEIHKGRAEPAAKRMVAATARSSTADKAPTYDHARIVAKVYANT